MLGVGVILDPVGVLVIVVRGSVGVLVLVGVTLDPVGVLVGVLVLVGVILDPVGVRVGVGVLLQVVQVSPAHEHTLVQSAPFAAAT